MAAAAWKPDIVSALLTYLDLPTQGRLACVSTAWVPQPAVAAIVAAAEKLINRVACPFAALGLDAPSSASPARAFLLAARTIWRLVALPLLELDGRILECPGLLGDGITEVHVLGIGRHRCNLSESWWRQRIGRWEEEASG